MNIFIEKTAADLGLAAAETTAVLINNAITEKGEANVCLATGASQFEVLKSLIDKKNIDWSKVRIFHLDEYIGMGIQHKASFRKYLTDRFLSKVSDVKEAYLINGENDAEEECRKVGEAIIKHPVDVALVGVGENGHLAFNDPPADFETKKPYLIVGLDEKCRLQQVNEGWFSRIEEVPAKAISMSIQQIMLSKAIVCSVPDERKAAAINKCFAGKISTMWPASILQEHSNCYLYLDEASSSKLKAEDACIS